MWRCFMCLCTRFSAQRENCDSSDFNKSHVDVTFEQEHLWCHWQCLKIIGNYFYGPAIMPCVTYHKVSELHLWCRMSLKLKITLVDIDKPKGHNNPINQTWKPLEFTITSVQLKANLATFFFCKYFPHLIILPMVPTGFWKLKECTLKKCNIMLYKTI